ncbi:B12-binding domain-containing radical SAM protein [Rhodanobacter thiooxydans]|uniref:B12-binding domain-containing radical SAM protein n=1 Tax=Rhodanobacter thiooxydans TaxID=416169 RepID=A0A154QCV5_9GAMM|nr:B12-binding domain-containing radical SAM protein [Rhodanobacter thiooxydans]EIL97299.1 radical SAM protein [Rhodanobacter thiooxydans LCS2]KZC22051.1 B12-binding domain-containing radical SAM protein [Rhodanobacter thiooxydans]MCW0202874.1 B12-binding domain-containing radical SAM protein [Rhodanobacter thiooxydans]
MTSPRTLLINPTITSRSSARFPLALLHLAAALERSGSSRIVDGNVDRDFVDDTLRALERERYDAVGVGVMGGPQVAPAIAVSKAIRARYPALPIVWGGYFPTLHTDATLAAPYVDYAVRAQGEDTLSELVAALAGDGPALAQIAGLSWKHAGDVVHNPPRRIVRHDPAGLLPYDKLGDPRRYLARTYLGQRTVAHQAAIGCRYHCTFCGVAAMFGGATFLPAAARLERELTYLKHTLGADSVQYFDHNFFDREADMVPLLEVMARFELPWWCFARADALLKLSERSWALVRKSRLRMAYIGAESPSDQMLHDIRKGTHPDQTLAVVEQCRRYGVIPELSFMVAPPENTEEETERTFEFIRELKRINPQTEVVIYIYTPLPEHSRHEQDRRKRPGAPLLDLDGAPVVFPTTPDEWTESRWVHYACHVDAPWLSDRLRQRINDFVTVLRCRYPTVQDLRAPPWAKRNLSAMAGWRYRFRRYDRPWELHLANRFVRLRMPQVSGL